MSVISHVRIYAGAPGNGCPYRDCTIEVHRKLGPGLLESVQMYIATTSAASLDKSMVHR
jgi:hypothetical protein